MRAASARTNRPKRRPPVALRCKRARCGHRDLAVTAGAEGSSPCGPLAVAAAGAAAAHRPRCRHLAVGAAAAVDSRGVERTSRNIPRPSPSLSAPPRRRRRVSTELPDYIAIRLKHQIPRACYVCQLSTSPFPRPRRVLYPTPPSDLAAGPLLAALVAAAA